MKSPIINRLIFILAVSYWYQPVVMSQVTSGAQGCNYIYWQWNGANQEYPRIVDFYLHANGNLDLGIFQKQTVEDGWGESSEYIFQIMRLDPLDLQEPYESRGSGTVL